MKKTLILVFTLLSTCVMWGKQLSQNEAMDVARNFFGQSGDLRSTEEIKLAAVAEELTDVNNLRSAADESAFYVFNRGNSGFVIVAGDDRMKQVLGYSKNSAFVTENIPANLKAMLNAYSVLHANLDKVSDSGEESEPGSSDQFAEEVQPLLGEINWYQGEPYNLDCPEIDGERALTGCVATASAMIMKYYEYPTKGNGSYSYTTISGDTYSFDYDKNPFEWDKMLPQYGDVQYTEEQAKAVANLMSACGVAFNMEYSPEGSGSETIEHYENALIYLLGYNKNLGYVKREYFTSEEWMDMVKEELNAERPVFYSGVNPVEGGHQFIIDGYDENNLVHVNWGWGGNANGYYEIFSLDPRGSNCSVYGFSMSQEMVLGFQPNAEGFNYTSFFAMDNMVILDSEQQEKLNEVKKGETFSIGLTGLYNMSSTFNKGKIAIIVKDQEGNEREISKKDIYESLSYSDGLAEIIPFETSIDNNFEDGIYLVYAVTQEEREENYSIIRGTIEGVTQYLMNIEGENCTFVPFTGIFDTDDLHATIESPEVMFTGEEMDFKITFGNNSDSEFFGLAGIALINKEIEETEESKMSLHYPFQVLIPENSENNTYEFSIPIKYINPNQDSGELITPPSGEYYIAPYVVWGDDGIKIIGEPKAVTIYQSCETVNVTKEAFVRSEIYVGETLEYMADIVMDGEGDGFKGELVAVIYDANDEVFDYYPADVIFGKDEEPYKFEMDINADLNPGNYQLILYQSSEEGPIQLNEGLYFSVNYYDDPTSIEAMPDGTDGLTVYGITEGNNIRIKTSDLAEQVDIFTITGQKVHQEKLTPGVGNIYNLNAANISEGVYIMVVRTSDGKMYRTKFRR